LWAAAWAALGQALQADEAEQARRQLQRLQFLRRFLDQLPRPAPG